MDKLGFLLHLSDPTLPIGGYAHSYGLETYVQNGRVSDVKSAKKFVENSLNYNVKFNDAIYVRLAWQAMQNTDYDTIAMLDGECTAIKSPSEIRNASLKLGVRLLKIFNRKLEGESIAMLESLTKNSGGHYPIIYSAVAFLLGLTLEDTVFSFYYTTMVCMITNAVKLIPLGQLSGQDIVFSLEEKLEDLTLKTLDLDPELRGLCAVGFDMASMQHERLYSRLYMS